MTWLKIQKDQKKVSYTMRFPVEDFLFSACRYFCPKGSAALQNAFFMPKRNRWFRGAHYSLRTYMGRLVYFHLKGPTTSSTRRGKDTIYSFCNRINLQITTFSIFDAKYRVAVVVWVYSIQWINRQNILFAIKKTT